MEKELVSIAVVIKAFFSMLLGAVLLINTDHNNLTFPLLTAITSHAGICTWNSMIPPSSIVMARRILLMTHFYGYHINSIGRE